MNLLVSTLIDRRTPVNERTLFCVTRTPENLSMALETGEHDPLMNRDRSTNTETVGRSGGQHTFAVRADDHVDRLSVHHHEVSILAP